MFESFKAFFQQESDVHVWVEQLPLLLQLIEVVKKQQPVSENNPIDQLIRHCEENLETIHLLDKVIPIKIYPISF